MLGIHFRLFKLLFSTVNKDTFYLYHRNFHWESTVYHLDSQIVALESVEILKFE